MSFRKRGLDGEMLDRPPGSRLHRSARPKRGMVATAHDLGTATGVAILENGGMSVRDGADFVGVAEPWGDGVANGPGS